MNASDPGDAFEQPHFPGEQASHVVMAWASASLLCTLLFIVCYSALPSVRQTPGWQLLRSTVCELVESSLWLVMACVDRQRYAHLIWPPLLACDIAANGLRLTMYVDLLIVYRNPFSPRTFRPLYYFLVAWAALGGALSAIFAGDHAHSSAGGFWGTMRNFSSAPDVLVWDLVYLPCLSLYLVGGLLYALMRVLLLQRHESAFAHVSDLARLRAVRHCGAYLCVYGLLLGGLVLVYQLDVRKCDEGLDAGSAAVFGFLAGEAVPDAGGGGSFTWARGSGGLAGLLLPGGLSCPTLWHAFAALTAGRPALAFAGWLVINDVPRALCARWREPGRGGNYGCALSLHALSEPAQSGRVGLGSAPLYREAGSSPQLVGAQSATSAQLRQPLLQQAAGMLDVGAVARALPKDADLEAAASCNGASQCDACASSTETRRNSEAGGGAQPGAGQWPTAAADRAAVAPLPVRS
ncbi:hypothetical protein T492DRAFT_836052 [Pavlovales sp. CCMP2436]|nr:hypothetical protein T492DRAFT_836052 [Pavlovales sp. CCMP2436]